MKWLSLHIFYYENRLFFVSKLLPELFNALKREHSVHKYFYIIYNENGPHIRVRILCEISKINFVVDLSQEYIGSFLRKFPSASNVEIQANWHPNNSIQLIDYQPEVDRYGGIERLPIAENYFMYSTITVLSALSERSKNYIRNLTFAIRMHMIFAYVLFDFQEIKVRQFFEILYQFGYRSSSGANYFIKYEENILSSVSKVRKELCLEASCDKCTQEWLEFSKIIVMDLSNAYSFIETNIELQEMLSSYFHMTNNRLGINPIHEEYLYYFILKVLEQY